MLRLVSKHLISDILAHGQYSSLLSRKMSHEQEMSHEHEFIESHEQNYIDMNTFQKSVLTVGSGIWCLFDPTRADLISTFGEVSAGFALNHMYDAMSKTEEGQTILAEKPRINSKIIDLNELKTLPDNTVGKIYSDFLETNKVTPDSRLPVQFIRDTELAYVMQRYREIHDLVHAVLKQPTNMLGEVTIKWVEGIQTKLPMCVTGGLFGAMRLRPKQRKRYREENLPWAIRTGRTSKMFMNVYFEKRWEQSLEDFYREMNITPLVSKYAKKSGKAVKT
uniref:Ubiquinone biosynthesis protein COQ4 homolog, mitochondrial n=2 Tax=Cacopsylla melanoneura TaxID=428564 RepID=A0A8D8ZFM1_9HEMI